MLLSDLISVSPPKEEPEFHDEVYHYFASSMEDLDIFINLSFEKLLVRSNEANWFRDLLSMSANAASISYLLKRFFPTYNNAFPIVPVIVPLRLSGNVVSLSDDDIINIQNESDRLHDAFTHRTMSMEHITSDDLKTNIK